MEPFEFKRSGTDLYKEMIDLFVIDEAINNLTINNLR